MASSLSTHKLHSGRLRCAIGAGLFAVFTALPGAIVAEAPPPAPAASPVTVVTPADEGLMKHLSNDDDVILVAGMTAVTVLGLTGLALLDRRPGLPDHEAEPFDHEPEDLP